MKTYVYFSLFIFVVIFSSCTGTKDHVSNPVEVKNIQIDLDSSKVLSLAEFASEVKYLKLETSGSSLFAQIDKLIINKHGIFILDKYTARKIYYFTLDGKFVRTIGNTGKGNGEYTLPLDFLVREDTKRVEIVDNFTRCNYIYDLEGNFIDRIKYDDYRIASFTLLNGNDYLIKLSNNKGLKYEGFNFIVVDKNMKSVKNKVLPVKYDADFINKKSFSNCKGNSILFSCGFNDTIYEATDFSFYPKYIVDFGKLKLKESDVNKGEREAIALLLSSDQAGYISNLTQTEDAMFFNFLSHKNDYLYGLNIKTGEKVLISKLKQNDNVTYLSRLISIYNDLIVFKADPLEICDKSAEPKNTVKKNYGEFGNFEDVQRNTQLNDNPILIFVKAKI